VTGSHTIAAAFTPSGHAEISSTALYDYAGVSLNGNSLKTGYGVFASVNANYGDVHDVSVTARYNFGSGEKSIALAETANGVFQFPVNAQSTQNHRCVYIPVDTQDGAYTITFTITATDAAGNTLTDTKTNTLTIQGTHVFGRRDGRFVISSEEIRTILSTRTLEREDGRIPAAFSHQ
jgi:hypothetical protein